MWSPPNISIITENQLKLFYEKGYFADIAKQKC
jgi:hypothetical protein